MASVASGHLASVIARAPVAGGRTVGLGEGHTELLLRHVPAHRAEHRLAQWVASRGVDGVSVSIVRGYARRHGLREHRERARCLIHKLLSPEELDVFQAALTAGTLRALFDECPLTDLTVAEKTKSLLDKGFLTAAG